MAALAFSLATRPAAFASQQQRRGGAARSGRRLQRCFATSEKEQLDFTSNKRSALGFTESDSAGQTNVFAVEPKTYVAGSSADKTDAGSQATLAIAGIAAVAAAGAVAAGLLTNSGAAELAALAPAPGSKTLSAYAQQFSSGGFSAAAPAAPALADK